MYLKPCRNCSERKTCIVYKSTLKAFRGTGITSAQFICKPFMEQYKPGERVQVVISERFEYCKDSDNVSGTVMSTNQTYRKGKVLICLDEEPFYDEFHDRPIESKNPFFNFWPKHIIKLDEPDVKVCPMCGIPDGVEHTENFQCELCKNIKPTKMPF